MSKGFFKDDEFKNKQADEDWTPEENDKFLELYLAGITPINLAHKLERNPKAIKRRIDRFTYNEFNAVVKYKPVERASRQGARFTQNEMKLIAGNKERNVPVEATAKVVQRPKAEIGKFYVNAEDRTKWGDMKRFGPGVDLCLAYRYAYYCKGISLVTDQAYDEIEREEKEFGANGQILDEIVGSDNPEDYPLHIRALAMYLLFKYAEVKKEGEEDDN